MMFAAQTGLLRLGEGLLAKGSDPNRKKEDGWTAMMLAAHNGHLEMSEMLLRFGGIAKSAASVVDEGRKDLEKMLRERVFAEEERERLSGLGMGEELKPSRRSGL